MMNFKIFKYLFSKTRRPYYSELLLAKDGILSCPECHSIGIVVSGNHDSLGHGHCNECKFTGNLNLFMAYGLDDRYKVPSKRLNVECPDCGAGSQLIVRDGKYGLFVGCSNYPACNYLMNIEISTRVEV